MTTHEQVTDRIEHFVTHKFVFKTQAVFVQYAIIVNNDGTIEAAAQAQTTGLQIFDITHETERTRTADLAHKRISGEVHRIALVAGINSRMVKIDGEIQRKTIVRLKFSPLIAIFDTNSFFNANKFLGAVQLVDTGVKQQVYKRSGAAVHDRDFRRVNFDNNVIDAQARESSIEVLYG